MKELSLQVEDLFSLAIKKLSSLSTFIFNWRALKSQFRPLSYSSSVKMTILRDVMNTFGLLKVIGKIDSYRQVKNPYTCVATCCNTPLLFHQILLSAAFVEYFQQPIVHSASWSCMAWGQEGRCGTRLHRSISTLQVFERSCYSTDLHSRQITWLPVLSIS